MDFPQPREPLILVGFAFFYVLLFIYFFPPLFVSIDEYWYAQNGVHLAHGTIEASSYPIGKAIFLIPFTWGGMDGIMLSGLIIHLLNFALLIFILRKLKLNSLYSLLYLFFPAFVYASRTLFSELLVITLFLIGFWFYIGQKIPRLFFSGFSFGLASLVRADALIGAAAFGANLLHPFDLKKIVAFGSGVVLGVIPLLVTNWVLNGSPFSLGYGSVSHVATAGLDWGQLVVNFLLYGVILLLAYPLMLISPFKQSHKDIPINAFLLLIPMYLLFNARFTNFFWFEFNPLTLFTARLRYLMPLIGLLIIPYTAFLHRVVFRIPHQKVLATILIIFLALGTTVAFAVHQQALEKREGTKEQIYAHTTQGSAVIGSSDDRIYFLEGIDAPRFYYKVNDPNVTLPPSAFVMDLSYANQENDSQRGQIVINERKAIKDFIAAHADELTLVYHTDSPNALTIYSFNLSTN